jgi:hypothetical protein
MKETKTYVDSLFSGYEETGALADFKEELASNMADKVASLVKKGMDEESAFTKAASELGDISALADEISLRKKQEVLGEAYMNVRRYMTPRRVAAYVISGAALVFGMVSAAIAFLGESGSDFGVPSLDGLIENSHRFTVLFGVLLPFVPVSAAGFTWLGLTQELPALYPMSRKRALWYALGVCLLTAGIILVPLTYFSTGSGYSLVGALGILIPLVIPAAGLLVFLALTEKDRKKPWTKLTAGACLFHDLKTEARFGMFSGAIWMGAAALFVLFGFIAGFRYSWITFLFAVPVQLCVQGLMLKNEKKKNVRRLP